MPRVLVGYSLPSKYSRPAKSLMVKGMFSTKTFNNRRLIQPLFKNALVLLRHKPAKAIEIIGFSENIFPPKGQ